MNQILKMFRECPVYSSMMLIGGTIWFAVILLWDSSDSTQTLLMFGILGMFMILSGVFFFVCSVLSERIKRLEDGREE